MVADSPGKDGGGRKKVEISYHIGMEGHFGAVERDTKARTVGGTNMAVNDLHGWDCHAVLPFDVQWCEHLLQQQCRR